MSTHVLNKLGNNRLNKQNLVASLPLEYSQRLARHYDWHNVFYVLAQKVLLRWLCHIQIMSTPVKIQSQNTVTKSKLTLCMLEIFHVLLSADFFFKISSFLAKYIIEAFQFRKS